MLSMGFLGFDLVQSSVVAVFSGVSRDLKPSRSKPIAIKAKTLVAMVETPVIRVRTVTLIRMAKLLPVGGLLAKLAMILVVSR